MNAMELFLKRFDEMKEKYPSIYMNIQCTRNNSWWRVHIFGRDMAAVGDAELLYAINMDREATFKEALSKMEMMENQINNLKEKKYAGNNGNM